MPDELIATITATFAIFVAGQITTSIRAYRQSKNETDNIRRILIKELVLDYQWLMNAWPSHGSKPQTIIESATVATVAAKLETSVYDTYIGKLYILPEADMQAIYDTYQVLRQNKSLGSEFEELRHRNQPANSLNYKNQMSLVALYSDAAKTMLEKTLLQLLGSNWKSALPYQSARPEDVIPEILKNYFPDMYKRLSSRPTPMLSAREPGYWSSLP